MSQPKIQMEAIAQAAKEYEKELERINGASMLPLNDIELLAEKISDCLSEKIVERLLWSQFGRGFVVGYVGGIEAMKRIAAEED